MPNEHDTTQHVNWDALVAAMDRIAAHAVQGDRAVRHITLDEVALGFTQLARLRHTEEPNYDQRGLGTAYLLYYLVKRSANFAAAISDLPLPTTVRVLDIGSGTNAAALALSQRFPEREFEIWAAEPSEEMAAAGRNVLSNLPNVISHWVPATLDDILEQRCLRIQQFDLICMSAMLSYGWALPNMPERVEFGEKLLSRVTPGGSIVAVEPGAKGYELQTLRHYLQRVGMTCRVFSALDTSQMKSWDGRLVETTAVLKEWYPGMRSSRNLSAQAREMLGPPWPLGLGGRLPDEVLVATRAIGPAPHRPPQRVSVPAFVSLGAQPPIIATRLPRQPGYRSWVFGLLVAGAAIAAALFAIRSFS